MKKLACQNNGALWTVSDNGNLADAMVDYFTFIAPLMEPCRVRWTHYRDVNTNVPLLAACLATFKKESASHVTSCQGGHVGCVPEMLGVSCLDVSLIATLEQIDARSDAQTFHDRVRSDQLACTRATATEAQLQMLRSRISSQFGDAVCAASDMLGSSTVAAPASCSDGTDTDTGNTAGSVSTDRTSEDDAEGGGVNAVAIVAIAGAAVAGFAMLCYCWKTQQSKASFNAMSGNGVNTPSSSAHQPTGGIGMGYHPQHQIPQGQPHASVPVVQAVAVPVPMGVPVA